MFSKNLKYGAAMESRLLMFRTYLTSKFRWNFEEEQKGKSANKRNDTFLGSLR